MAQQTPRKKGISASRSCPARRCSSLARSTTRPVRVAYCFARAAAAHARTFGVRSRVRRLRKSLITAKDPGTPQLDGAMPAPIRRSLRTWQDVTEFGELIEMLRGMRGQTVEAAIFLPWDDGGFPVAQFSGTLREVEYQEKSHQPRWVLS